MIDETTAFFVLIAVCVGGGFLSSWMRFNASGEVFSGRKHGNALIIGAITGLGIAIGTSLVGVDKMTVPQFGVIVGLAFVTAVGVDRLKGDGNDMVARNSPSKADAPAAPPA